MQSAHGKIWKPNRPVEINLILTNLQAIVPEADLAVNEDLAAAEAAVVETATSVDAGEDRHPNPLLQSERLHRVDEAVDEVNLSADLPGEAPGRTDAPPARREEAPREEIRKIEDDNSTAVGVKEETAPRALLEIEDNEAPAPEIADPARPMQKLQLWIQGANVKKQLRKRVNWG